MAGEAAMYRERAQAEREAAAATSLPLRREQHLRSAEAWESMAAKLDSVAQHAAVNAKAKAELHG